MHMKPMKVLLLFLLSGVFTLDAEAITTYHEDQAALAVQAAAEAEAEAQREVAADMLWDQLLQAHVDREGNVDYRGMKADARFNTCVNAFSAIKMGGDWSRAQKMAYWINAYNVFTVKLIVDNYPLKSITDLKEPWKQKFITLDGKKYSLNQIENEILRPQFNDARIHFAINCASFSCPKLNNRAFFASSLDKVLDTLTRQFLKDTSRNKITATSVEISKIFDWYGVDFNTGGKTVIDFLNRYGMGVKPGTEVKYMEYDWSLNGK